MWELLYSKFKVVVIALTFYSILFSLLMIAPEKNKTTSTVSYLSNIVEISVRHIFQLLQLCHLIQHLVEVELGTQEI